MPFEWGIYVITNCVHPNNAALFNDNANEPVRGILPVAVDADARDNEKVSFSIPLDLLLTSVSSVGAGASWQQSVQHQELRVP